MDDFGRTVQETLPEDGTITTQYDHTQEGEVQTQTQTSLDGKQRTQERLQFDPAGRLTSRTRAGCTERLHYEGRLLVQLQGCTATQRYARNAWGQITHQTSTLHSAVTGAGAAPIQHSQRFYYTQIGQLQSRQTVGGEVLLYRTETRSALTSSVSSAVSLQRAWLTHLSKLTGQETIHAISAYLPSKWTAKAVLTDIAHKPFDTSAFALASLTHGNGLKQTWGGRSAPTTPTAQAAPTAQPAAISSTATSATTAAPSVSATPAAPVTPTALATPTTDAFGRQTSHTLQSGPHKGQAQTLVWNEAHQLIEVQDAQTSKSIASYRYDSLGNRISKTVNGISTGYVYDNAHRLIAQTSANGQVQREYLYADHRVHSILEGGKLYAVQSDWRGLPARVLDADQTSVWEKRFDAWGKEIDTTADANSPPKGFEMTLRLAGQQFDDETGLHYNIHRYYDPAHPSGRGQYLSPDPLGMPNGQDRYAYLNNWPHSGVDPLGLFKVPTGAFLGNSSYFVTGTVPIEPDTGHGDILHTAFAQYNAQNGNRFSLAIVDQIIINNYHSDANANGCYSIPFGTVGGGGQCNAKNHFDNPNDGPIYTKEVNLTDLDLYSQRTHSYKDGWDDLWIANTVSQINNNRSNYGSVSNNDMSRILNAFGQNSHTLADFYAHSNWLDDAARGGFVSTEYKDTVLNPFGKKKLECGWIPHGLNQTRLWEEGSDMIDYAYLYTGTVQKSGTANKVCGHKQTGDVGCEVDKTTHGYWAKDTSTELSGSQTYTPIETVGFSTKGMYFWENLTFDSASPPSNPNNPNKEAIFGTHYFTDNGLSPQDGDRIYVARSIQNRHQMAFHLAVEHSKKEIAKLYDSIANVNVGNTTIAAAFQFDRNALDNQGIVYRTLHSKQ